MKLELLAFGITKDIIGSTSKEIEIQEGARVEELKNLLELEFPELKKLKAYFIAVDNEYAENNWVLSHLNEIAIIPPVSGG